MCIKISFILRKTNFSKNMYYLFRVICTRIRKHCAVYVHILMCAHKVRGIHQRHSFGSPVCSKYRYASMTFSLKLSVKFCNHFHMPIVAFCLHMYFPFACMATFTSVLSTFIIYNFWKQLQNRLAAFLAYFQNQFSSWMH